jgi:hypothetical protein
MVKPTGTSRRIRPTWLTFVGAVFVVSTLAIIVAAAIVHPADISTADATWVLAFFTLVLAVGIPITIWEAGREGEESRQRFLAQEQDRFYAQLDGIYLDIQKMIIEHPHLANPDRSRNPDEEIQYEAFAFIVWNFLESICDYTGETEPSEAQSGEGALLRETWHCIVRHEGTLHAKWFLDPKNEHKFKPKFRKYIKREMTEWARSHPTGAATRLSGATIEEE